MKLSIVMPAYNEEKRIGKTLQEYSEFFDHLSKKEKFNYEIIVVINNTTDKTEEIVKKYLKKDKNIKYLNFKKGGKGFAIIEGFKDALKRKNDLIGFVDADLATPPSAFYYLVKGIGNNNGAIASRYVRGSIVKPKPTLRRYIVSRGFNLLSRALFMMPYKDTQCGAKLFKREAIKNTIHKLSLSRWAFDVDLLYTLRRQGFRIKEVPTIWSDRKYSKINFVRAAPMMALGIIRLRLINSPFKIFIKIYDKLIFTLIWRKSRTRS